VRNPPLCLTRLMEEGCWRANTFHQTEPWKCTAWMENRRVQSGSFGSLRLGESGRGEFRSKQATGNATARGYEDTVARWATRWRLILPVGHFAETVGSSTLLPSRRPRPLGHRFVRCAALAELRSPTAGALGPSSR
jgi:hypothetical protein